MNWYKIAQWQPSADSTIGGTIEGLGNIQCSLKQAYDLALNYPIVNIDPKTLKGFITDLDDKIGQGFQTMIDGKILRYEDMTDEQKQRVDAEEEARVNACHFSHPIIVAGTPQNPARVIDGNHRVIKAIRCNAPQIPARFIPLEALQQFVVK